MPNSKNKNTGVIKKRLVSALCLILCTVMIVTAPVAARATDMSDVTEATEVTDATEATDATETAAETEPMTTDAGQETDTGEATGTEEPPPEPPEVPDDEIPPFNEDDYLMRVGVYFRDDARDSHEVKEHNGTKGFELYQTTVDNEFHHIWTLDKNDVSVCEGGNLRKYVTSSSSQQWYYYASSSNIVAGGYHLQLDCAFISQTRTLEFIAENKPTADKLGLTIYPAYIDGYYRVRVGAYTSSSAAESDLNTVSEAFGRECSVTRPTSTCLTVIDYFTAEVYFDFDMSEEKYGLGLMTVKEQDKEVYIKTQRGYYFDGILEFRRYKSSDVDGVTMIYIGELERYVESVVPWEIYSTWPLETLKAFAVAARTYAISRSHENAKHASYYADVCDSSCCQVCLGLSHSNATVHAAVIQTAGQILLCDGEPIKCQYTDLGGGSMAAGHEVWNQAALKYLVGQMTPWEDLEANRYGHWEFTATPTELLAQLRAAGYTTLKNAVKSVKINRLCTDSTYVYSVTVTDTSGTSVTINRARNVKLAFSDYTNCANFVILHNGVIENGKPGGIDSVSGLRVMTENGIKIIKNETDISVMTAEGLKSAYLPERLIVKTKTSMLTCDVVAETLDFVGSTVPSGASSSDFVFIGSGHGHGVGASQWGCKDLANLGYSAEQILAIYYPHTDLVDYREYVR
ncbi:MAG: SpoIID/LytB domain-containing protein [Clostridia bacterium]|nr:SpoIID/LytB domain-containing protein [Clostridia bacterium]